MKVLLISQYYAPEETGNAPYVTGAAEHLSSVGHQVTVLTGMPHYPQWKVWDGYRWQGWKRETRNGVDLQRRAHLVPRHQSALWRALYEGSFLASGLSSLALARPDVVVGVVPGLSGGVVSRLAARRFRVPYGIVFQDLIGPATEQSNVSGASKVTSIVQRVEGWVARGASAIGVVAEGFRPYLESLGTPGGNVTRLRNWSHIAGPAGLPRAEVRERLRLPQDAVIALHAGNMGYKQGLENVIEAARLCEQREVLFVLMGDGNQRQHLESLAEAYGLSNLRFLPLQPAELYPDVLASADILLINQRGTVVDMSLPSKLTSYLLAGVPVVAAAAAGSETAAEVNAAGGVVAPADRPELLLQQVLDLAGDSDRRQRIADEGRRFAVDNLSPASALRSYEGFVERLASEADRSAESLPSARPLAGTNLKRERLER